MFCRFLCWMKLNVFILALLGTFGCSFSGHTEKQPNIIFLLTDDQRWDAMGAMGNKIIQTPNMDDLANNGVLFTNAHVTTSICCSSRASILSGQYVSRHGIEGFRTPFSPAALQQTYPMLLKNNGYSIGFIGKYGVGNPQDFPDSLYHYWGCDALHQPNYENEDGEGNFIHYTDIVSSRINEFLERFGKDEKPFCLSVSFKAPHCQDGDPRQFIYAERYKKLYANVEFALPETAGSSYYSFFPQDFRIPVFNGVERQNEARKRWEIRFPDKEKFQESVRSYYRLISGVDDAIGILRKKLEEIGKAENTIIVFMGDNGFYLGEHGLAGKWYAHRESVKVPFFVFDPRADESQRGKRVDEFALNIDVAPTILSLAGVEIPETMQGINALDLLSHKTPEREMFFYEHNLDIPTIPNSEAVISKKYKYIKYADLSTPFEEFYDLENDSLEKVNLVGEEKYADAVQEFRKYLEVMGNEVK
ncbi:sulfatase [Draconibacterium sp.]|uniref:sulfatase family protein n=1 Tax=Draconibacterium sp. TaxID=1965318 RepID=UPI0029C648A4|nr:sulfatase [uncultured Draconibacterium sp.]